MTARMGFIYFISFQSLLLLLLALCSNAVEHTVTGIFRESKPNFLKTSLQLNCDNDGDKIKISDIRYKTTGCQSSDTYPKDPAANNNSINIQQCTGKRTCGVPADYIKQPFQPYNWPSASCQISTKYQISVLYTCVPQDEIRSMCETFTTQEFMGYLSTPSYPMLLQPGVPIAPCRCHLEAVPASSRINLKLLEYNLVSNGSHEDMFACQSEVQKQYLDIDYGGSHTYLLCGHNYNDEMRSSSKLNLTFDNPIGREAGALWMEYSADEPDAMVKVSCDEPILTTTAPKYYTQPRADSNSSDRPWLTQDYKLILGLVAALLFLLIIIAIVVITVKYNSKISHYMLHKYSKRDSNGRREPRKEIPPVYPGNSVIGKNYQETHFDSVDETMSCGKPTAHIPPQLSVNEKLNKATGDDHDPKRLREKGKYNAFASTYLAKPMSDSDSDQSDSSMSKCSERSNHSATSETSSAPSVRRVLHPSMSRQGLTPTPKFEDIWVRVNSAESSPARRVSLGSQAESDRLMMSRPPTVSFNTGSRQALQESLPLMHQSENSGANSDDDEEMDIKFANPNLVSPRKTPVQAVKPALKYARHPNGSSPRSDSVTFSDIVHHSCHNPEYREAETEQQRKQRLKAAILQYPAISGSRTPPASTRKLIPSSQSAQPNSPLMVDMGGRQRKSKSLPNYARRMNSTPTTKTHSNSTKKPKRKCASDNERASSSSQEQLYPVHSPLLTNAIARPRTSAAAHQMPDRTLPVRTNRRNRIPENDDELIIRIDSDLDNLMHSGST